MEYPLFILLFKKLRGFIVLQTNKLESDVWQSHARQPESIVRDSGYSYAINLQLRLEDFSIKGLCSEELISKSFSLYEQSKALLRLLDPDNAENFIKNCYNPNK